MGAQRESWGDETFTDFADIRLARLQALNREEVWDTTNANGVSQVSLEKGQWWVHARYELPYSELYWNEPIEVTGGDPMQVLLNRSTAEARPRF
jgi:hypothetical protein